MQRKMRKWIYIKIQVAAVAVAMAVEVRKARIILLSIQIVNKIT
jgi:hypothetical protein